MILVYDALAAGSVRLSAEDPPRPEHIKDE